MSNILSLGLNIVNKIVVQDFVYGF